MLDSGAIPSVSVSQSHLSAERMKKLSSDLHTDDSLLKTGLYMVLIVLIGFGVGFVILSGVMNKDSSAPVGTAEELEFSGTSLR